MTAVLRVRREVGTFIFGAVSTDTIVVASITILVG